MSQKSNMKAFDEGGKNDPTPLALAGAQEEEALGG